MKYGSLVFEESEFLMIKDYHDKNVTVEDYAHKYVLELLSQNMATALVLESADIPFDIIKINSIIKVTTTSGNYQTFQIVHPNKVDIQQKKIAVLSSLGASLIGKAEGDQITYGLPGDIITLKIEKVKPPENSTETNPTLNNRKPKEIPIY